MLLYLTDYLKKSYTGFAVFDYITLRAILSVLTALIISFIVGPKMIAKLSHYQIGQPVRDDGPETHFSKAGTPTMGGALILVAVAISVLLWSDLSNRYVWVVLLTTLGVGLIGWIDDYKKLVEKNSDGLSAKYKYLGQSLVAIAAGVFLYMTHPEGSTAETTLIIPFVKGVQIDMGWFYIVFTYFVIVGTSNAVNFTDGLDGLAILPTVVVCTALGIFAYVAGHSEFATYLGIPHVARVSEVVVFCGAIAGAGLGFLWFNAYPAQVFMGDVGALALGAAIGVIAVVVRQELALVIMGGVFVMEVVSVIIQVASFKLTGKRIFRMAPLHHHYELKGWPEPRVIVRFWIITIILTLIGLASLKIR